MRRDAACIPASEPAGKDKMKHKYVRTRVICAAMYGVVVPRNSINPTPQIPWLFMIATRQT